jgi:hypothetical protein
MEENEDPVCHSRAKQYGGESRPTSGQAIRGPAEGVIADGKGPQLFIAVIPEVLRAKAVMSGIQSQKVIPADAEG